TVADRGLLADSPVITAFLMLLKAVEGRFTASEIFSLFEAQPLREAFELTESDLDFIASWISDTRICWGLDEETRAALDLPPFMENTWKTGIERMLLGFAMKGKNRSPFKGIAPYDGIEGQQAVVLGRFLDCIQCIAALRGLLKQSLSPADWAAALLECVERFFIENDDNAQELQVLRIAISECAASAEGAGFTQRVGADIIQNIVRSIMERPASDSGFLAGAVTFCEMLPMRGIPFKVVCMIGMNDTAFPRRSRNVGWNLMAANPVKGDRSLEKEDRYMFLEALLSARETLYISFIGQDMITNAPRQPSVAVTEILEYIDRAFRLPTSDTTPDRATAADSIIVRHRLQAFSPAYFTPGSGLFSYSHENFEAALKSALPLQQPPPFFSGPISELKPETRRLSIDDFYAFFKHPVKFLLRKRLGMHLRDTAPSAPDKEPFSIERLDAYAMGSDLVKRFLRKESRDACFTAFKAASLLPHGTVGVCAFNDLADEASEFSRRIESIAPTMPPQPLRFDERIGPVIVSGAIAQCAPSGFLMYRFARVKPRDLVQFWLSGLLLSARLDYQGPITNTLVTRDGSWELPRIPSAVALLESLFDKYRQGLVAPLHFFPATSWAYAEALNKGKSIDDAMRQANSIWT
ncbi:MAG TPA: hypothetical protein VF335_07275, partial [Chitinivibrionales bacterium]